MKPYRYFKTLAKIGLGRNFLKAIFAFLFVTLIPQMLLLLPVKFQFTDYQFLIVSALASFLLVPCFRMGAIGFVSDSLLKKETSLGNIFDGFKYILKLIPLIISKILPLIPVIVMSLAVFKFLSPEVLDILTKYAENPAKNMDMLALISDNDYNLMLLFELCLILSVVLSVMVSSYLALTEYILYNEKLPAFKAIFKSIKMMKGHILYYIGFNLSFIMWHLASSFTMGISMLILNPYKESSFIIFYNYLRFENGEVEIPEAIKEIKITEVKNEEE